MARFEIKVVGYFLLTLGIFSVRSVHVYRHLRARIWASRCVEAANEGHGKPTLQPQLLLAACGLRSYAKKYRVPNLQAKALVLQYKKQRLEQITTCPHQFPIIPYRQFPAKIMGEGILTSSCKQKNIIESFARGVNAFFRKPVEFKQVAKTVSRLGCFWFLTYKLPETN